MPAQDLNLRGVLEDKTFNGKEEFIPQNKWRRMYIAALAALMWAVTMGIAVGYASPATYNMQHNNPSPSPEEISWIGSILALGAMIGGLAGGPLADKWGRKSVLLLNVFTFTIGWLLISFSKHVGTIIAGRFVTGTACGIVSVTVPMYCVEISRNEVRGLLGSSFQGFMVIGSLLSAIIGSYINWQNLAFFGLGVAIFALFCFIWMPESPRWFTAQGDSQRARRVLRELFGNRVNVNEEYEAIYSEIANVPKGILTLPEFLNPTFYKPAILTVFLMFFQQFSGSNSVLFFSSLIFENAKSFMNPKISTIVLGVIQVISTLFSSFIVDKVGRKILLLLSGAFMTISLVALGIYYYESSKSDTFQESLNWMPLFCLCIYIISFSIGYGPLPWLLSAEMVPLRVRSTVVGIATFCNGLFAFIVTKTFIQFQNIVNNYGAFWAYAIISLSSCFFVIVFLPETKNKDIEEITNIFSRTKSEQIRKLRA